MILLFNLVRELDAASKQDPSLSQTHTQLVPTHDPTEAFFFPQSEGKKAYWKQTNVHLHISHSHLLGRMYGMLLNFLVLQIQDPQTAHPLGERSKVTEQQQ